MHPSPTQSTSIQDELISLGHNWFLHNPNLRAVRVRYEAIDANHPSLPAAETALHKITGVLLQITGCRATIIPCLHRSQVNFSGHVLGIVLHITMLNVEILEMVHLMQSPVPVHLYIGDPLATATPFDTYNPGRITLPEHLEPGDPIFCSGTRRAMVFSAYLHSAEDDDALYGLTIGQAVVSHADFMLHPRLKPRERQQRHVRSSQLAIQSLGRPLSNLATQVVEQAIRDFELEKANIYAELQKDGLSERSLAGKRRLRQHEAGFTMLRASLARPHDFEVGHACAAEALIRPCSGSGHGHSARGSGSTADKHTHLLSWTLMRMTSKTGVNPATLHAHPSSLKRGAAVSMHIRDPNVERPLGPYRRGVVNGAPASVIIGGYVAREWAVFSTGEKFAARGDAGALVISAVEGDQGSEDSTAIPSAMLYAVPERGPYGLVTPLTTILRRIRDVTGMQLRLQSWKGFKFSHG